MVAQQSPKLRVRVRILAPVPKRALYNGNTSDFQSDAGSSILPARSRIV